MAEAALQGFATAQDSLANACATGIGVAKNEATVTWWTKVAAQGGSLGQIAQQNIAVFYNRQQQKQLDAQEDAKRAEMLKKNAGECEIQFTISNDSPYSLEVGESSSEEGGIFICDKDTCDTNLLFVPGQYGIGQFTSIEPNYPIVSSRPILHFSLWEQLLLRQIHPEN